MTSSFLDGSILNELLEETLSLIHEDGDSGDFEKFISLVKEYLPDDVLESLKEILGDESFLEDIWHERFEVHTCDDDDPGVCFLLHKCCQICERSVRLTEHHLYPRETHKTLLKRGHDKSVISQTISICRMCHSTIHRFFTNDELSAKYYTIELLLSDERYFKYAKWASKQHNSTSSRVR